jgi:hypothetical protein
LNLPIEYSREWASWHQHIMSEGGYPAGVAKGSAIFWSNKAQPFLQTLNEDWQNKNYFGQLITNPNDSQWQQYLDHAKFWVSNLMPISTERLLQNTGEPFDPWDMVSSAAGFPKAPAWTTRTDTENRITDTYHRMFPSVKNKEDIQKQAAHQSLRKAVLEKNQAAIHEAVKQLRAQHVTDAQIVKLEKQAHIPYETYMFKRLNAEDQRYILNQMSPEELKIYAPLSNKAIRHEYLKKVHPSPENHQAAARLAQYSELAEKVRKPIYFVLVNHDRYGSTFATCWAVPTLFLFGRRYVFLYDLTVIDIRPEAHFHPTKISAFTHSDGRLGDDTRIVERHYGFLQPHKREINSGVRVTRRDRRSARSL